jgi:hypothetical protein
MKREIFIFEIQDSLFKIFTSVPRYLVPKNTPYNYGSNYL